MHINHLLNGMILQVDVQEIPSNHTLFLYTKGSSNIAGKWGPRIEERCISVIKHGDIPASYVSLPEGMCLDPQTPEKGLKGSEHLGIWRILQGIRHQTPPTKMDIFVGG